MCWADNCVRIWQNLSISNPKPEGHNINAQTQFDENPLTFTQVIVQKQKYWQRDRWTDMDGHKNTQTTNVMT